MTTSVSQYARTSSALPWFQASQTLLPSMPSLPGKPHSLASSSSGALARPLYLASKSIRSM
ncbi:Uncharacterised protein [Bordetella pertussis]|nr:Uncharacterised protein [Bordetella pertussis]